MIKRIFIVLSFFICGIAASVAQEGQAEFDKAFQYIDLNQSEDAFKMMKAAAEKGHIKAMFNYGVMYFQGYGTLQNYGEALHWYQKASLEGDTSAMVNAAQMYEHGIGVEKDFDLAVSIYEVAAENNNPVAMNWLAEAYWNIEEFTTAEKWYQKAINIGDVPAIASLGLLYTTGGNGVSQDYERAFRLFQIAADKGDPNGMFYLGTLYISGNGVTADIREGKKWVQQAANLGVEEAKELLSKIP